ncbi:MAG: class I SAM-dependent methyltransferase [Bacteroidales bacterium]|nr:class I SAM-dependent methyltransferase [Bacteroidales bacterium]
MIYSILIDPMLNSSHTRAASLIKEHSNVLDVACGPGALTLMITMIAETKVTGIDLDPNMIKYAERKVRKKAIRNARFLLMDATDLTQFNDKEFDVAVISLALHQFSPEAGLKVLQEMKRVAKSIIIVDYAYPIKAGFYRWFTWTIEWLAGGDHYCNFKQYQKNGGMDTLLHQAGLRVKERYLQGKGTLMVSLCEF